MSIPGVGVAQLCGLGHVVEAVDCGGFVVEVPAVEVGELLPVVLLVLLRVVVVGAQDPVHRTLRLGPLRLWGSRGEVM